MKNAILTLMLLGLGAVATAQEEVRKITLTEDTEQNSSVYNYYTGNVLLEIPSHGLQEFKINTGAGEVEITSSALSIITVEAEIVIMAGNAKKANNYLSRDLKLSLEKKNGLAILISSFDYIKEQKHAETMNPFDFLKSPDRQINLKIKVPKGIFLSIDDNSGDLILANLINNVDIHDGSGLVYLNNIDGDIDIDDNSGDIVLKNINKQNPQQHRIKIYDNSGGIRLENIRGDMSLTDASGDIRITDLMGSLSINDASGEIRLSNIEGDIKINDASGDIISRTVAGNIEVYDNSGDIYIRDVLLDVNIKAAGAGDLTLEEVRGKISGDLRRLNN
jgi:hypothetical protein